MDQGRRSTLVTLIARYVDAAMPIAMSNLQQQELIGLPSGRWRSVGPSQFQREDVVQLSWVVALDRRAAQLHALREFHEAVAFVESNEAWRQQLDTLVGTWQSRTRLEKSSLLDRCLADALSARVEGRDPAEAVQNRAESIEAFLDASHLSIESLSPLLGFSAPNVGRIQIDSNVSIEPITEVEAERLFSVGLLMPTMPTFPFIHAPSHMVRASYSTPKVVGERELSEELQAQFLDNQRMMEESIADLVVSLRLLKPGLVGLSGRVTGTFSSYLGSGYNMSPGRAPWPFHMPTYSFDPSDVDNLLELWLRLHSVGARNTKHLILAARRFSYKGDRTRVDDQLVDLIVAAEALFLGDADEDARGELRFRLSSRAAAYVHDPVRSNRSIFRLLMAAYRLRSRLVHGGDAKPVKVDGEQFTAEQMVEVVENLLRAALKQAFQEASAKSRRWTVDWDALLFPATDVGTANNGDRAPPTG